MDKLNSNELGAIITSLMIMKDILENNKPTPELKEDADKKELLHFVHCSLIKVSAELVKRIIFEKAAKQN